MRLLTLTLYGKNVLGYGPFETYRSFAISAANAGHFIEFIIPKNKERGFDYDADRLHKYLDHPRIRLHEVSMLKGGLNQWAAVPLEVYDKFNLTSSGVFYDAVLSNWIGAHPMLKRALMRKSPRNMIDIPLFGLSTEDAEPFHRLREQDIIAQCVGMVNDYVCWLTENQKTEWLAYMRKMLSPSYVRRVRDTSCVAAVGSLDCEWLDRINAAERLSPVVLGYGGRFSEIKGMADMLDIYASVASVVPGVRAMFTTGDKVEESRARSLRKKYQFAEFYGSVARREYLSAAKSWDLGLCLSTREGMGTGYREMMYCGVILLFLDGKFAREVTPPGYPFICKDFKELRPRLAWMARNLSEVKKWVEPCREHVRAIGDNATECKKATDWIIATTESHYLRQLPKKTSSLYRLFTKVAKECGEPFTMEDFCKRLQTHTKGNYCAKSSFIGKFFTRWALQGYGYKDDCSGPDPKFTYTGEVMDIDG